MNWSPWNNENTKQVNIKDNKCNPWKITAPGGPFDKPEDIDKKIRWSPQITTSMPLEALYSLMKEQVITDPINRPERNVLNGANFRGQDLALVTKDFFKAKPNGIDGSTVQDDTLAFLTLVLSYAKAATVKQQKDQSPKLFTTFMPRTEFNTIFGIVQSKLCGDLWELFNKLACYKIKSIPSSEVV